MYKPINKTIEAVNHANELLNFVNDMGCDTEAFADTICRGHRTLQQSTMRLFVEVARKMATNGTDARNENAVKLAQQISEIADQYNLPLI